MRSWLHRVGPIVGGMLRRLLTPRLFRAGPPHPARDHRIDIYTFVTDEDDYAGMLASFRLAGFAECATFVRLSDATSEPFSAITDIGRGSGAPYAVLCHQDIRLTAISTPARLFGILDQLERRDGGWWAAGPAGVTQELEVARAVLDLWGGRSDHDMPVLVMSLDEVFLILNRANQPRCTPDLRGFHFYGTDLCLNAIAAGGSCYVVDFQVIHLGLGNLKDGYRPAYDTVRQAMVDAWATRLWPTYIGTTIEVLALSRCGLVSRVMNSERTIRWVSEARSRSGLEAVAAEISAMLPDVRRQP